MILIRRESSEFPFNDNIMAATDRINTGVVTNTVSSVAYTRTLRYCLSHMQSLNESTLTHNPQSHESNNHPNAQDQQNQSHYPPQWRGSRLNCGHTIKMSGNRCGHSYGAATLLALPSPDFFQWYKQHHGQILPCSLGDH